MRAAILLAVALALGGIALVPTASAVCSGDTFVDEDCRNIICTVKNLKGPWINECWGIIGPPP